LLSEAGCAGVADPGMELIAFAHKHEIEVIPMVGPSSILLALIGSGLNGQGFTFHGYLPIEKNEKIKKLNEMQNNAHKTTFTQIFMETPFRNNAMLQDIVVNCDGNMMLTIATDLTGKAQSIKTKKLSDWKKDLPDIHKIPTVFCINYTEAK
jgi:16S rRNA (cytidine1402-2'-O)-methyltransferase